MLRFVILLMGLTACSSLAFAQTTTSDLMGLGMPGELASSTIKWFLMEYDS